jgi:hypothetical protein
VAARDRIYPEGVRDLFKELGINPIREAEVYHLGRLEPGLHHYGGFLHFVGSIESGRDALLATGMMDLEPVNDNFSVGFTAKVGLVHPCFGQSPVVQMDFSAKVPWVLREPEPE